MVQRVIERKVVCEVLTTQCTEVQRVRVRENCSNVSDSRQLTIVQVQMIKKKTDKRVTRLVLDQNSSGDFTMIHDVLYILNERAQTETNRTS